MVILRVSRPTLAKQSHHHHHNISMCLLRLPLPRCLCPAGRHCMVRNMDERGRTEGEGQNAVSCYRIRSPSRTYAHTQITLWWVRRTHFVVKSGVVWLCAVSHDLLASTWCVSAWRFKSARLVRSERLQSAARLSVVWCCSANIVFVINSIVVNINNTYLCVIEIGWLSVVWMEE